MVWIWLFLSVDIVANIDVVVIIVRDWSPLRCQKGNNYRYSAG